MRVLRVVLIITITLMLFVSATVIVSRGDAPRCLVLLDDYTVAPITYILDTHTGYFALDRREVQRLYTVESPDGRFRAGFVQRFGERASMTLQVEDQTGVRVVQTSVDASSESDGYRQIAWSRDSSAFAFMWRDMARRRYLSIAGADGAISRTIPFTRTVPSQPTIDPVTIAGWTGDGRYVSVSEFDGSRFHYHYFAADGLVAQPTPLDGLPIMALDFSPTGDLVAAISLDAQRVAQLNIVSISGEQAPIHLPLDLNAWTWGVTWSPTGAFVMIERISDCDLPSCDFSGWYFDLYRSDGTAITTLRGQPRRGMPSGMLPAMWQGDRWVWIEQSPDSMDINLSMLDARTGERTLLISALNFDYAGDMFYVSPDAEWFSTFSGEQLYPMATDSRVIVPYRVDGKDSIDLLDTATGERRELLHGVDRITRPDLGLGSVFWSNDGTTVLLSWQRVNEGAFLTVADLQTGTQVTTPPIPATIWVPQFIDPIRIGFFSASPDGSTLNVFDTISAEVTHSIPVDRNLTRWEAAFSTDGRTLALAAGTSSLVGKPLTLVETLDGAQQLVEVSAIMTGTFLWSPDGERLAFGEYADRQGNVAISDRSGMILARYYPPAFASTPTIQFIGWTHC